MFKKLNSFIFLMAISFYSVAIEVQPAEIKVNADFICETSKEFVQSQIESINFYDSNMASSTILWSDDLIEVVSVAHSTMCGNLGCTAAISFKVGKTCFSKSISSVQPHMPLNIGSGFVDILNVSSCVRFKLKDKEITKSNCD